MKSAWERGEGEGRQSIAPLKASQPPPFASEEERSLHRIFALLKAANETLPRKKAAAEKVLNGEYGVRNELLAKLMMGPLEMESIIADQRDVVPALLELAVHRDVDVRVKAAKVLGERGDERALLALYNGLEEPEYWARYEFAAALAKIARRLTDVESVSEIYTVLRDNAEAREGKKGKDGLAYALAMVKGRLERLKMEMPEERKPFPKMIRIEPSCMGPDTTQKLFRKR
ncbi:MAG: HEAT repeat domain-containing protein [Candidatus Bilamarchaeaceae archaeon]